jgi:hypothetical protein
MPNSCDESWRDVSISDHLTDEQKHQLSELISQYEDVLTSKPGCTNILKHSVHTVDNVPIHLKPYRIPQSMKAVVKAEIDKMLGAGIIEPTNSPYASPVVLVKKRDKSWRFCADYRKLNAKTVFDPQPMPRVDDLVENVGNAKFISTLDLAKGYWQILLDEDAKRKSAFITPFGCYQFRVMPFGMQCAGATFMRLMREVLRGTESFADTYVDDIIIYSNTLVDHIRHLTDILERLRKAGLTARPKKCNIGQKEAHYLGYVIGNGQLKPDMAKVKSIVEFPQPTTKTEVRSFAGLANYYRSFVPNFADLMAPLHDLTKKNASLTVVWTPECEQSFVKLKELMTKAPVLCSPDYSLPFVVQVDASEHGLGAVLSQVQAGEEHPICYLNRKLLPRESNYATIEKECLAIVWALRTLDVYLFGRSFTVQTDHNPIRWLNDFKGKNQRLLRWSLTLQDYKFQVAHRKGVDNGNADALSRAYT